VAKAVTSGPIDVGALDVNFSRADVEFFGVDHSGVSFAARVFLNNPAATESTAQVVDEGYAGTFHVFGHGGCFGDVGHCDVHPRRLYDPRPAHPLTPARKKVIATDALQRAMARGGELTVTVVPIITGLTVKTGRPEDVLKFDSVRIVTYR